MTDLNALFTPQIVLNDPRYQPDNTMAALMTGVADGQPIRHPSAWHLGGVWWYDAEPPQRKGHKHWAQTVGWAGLSLFLRCPCGAACYADSRGGWMEEQEPRFAAEPPRNPRWRRLWLRG